MSTICSWLDQFPVWAGAEGGEGQKTLGILLPNTNHGRWETLVPSIRSLTEIK